jgi:predicted RND superfamily exporter protein
VTRSEFASTTKKQQMIFQLTLISWTGVLLAFAAYFVLGAAWYVFLFPQAYRRSLGKENKPVQNTSLIVIAGPALCTFIITLTTSMLIYALNIDNYASAVEFAMLIGFGFLVANTVNIAINPNIPRPIFYGAITGGYHLVGIILACLIITAMK